MIDLWNALPFIAKVLLKGLAFASLCCLLALFAGKLKASKGISRRRFWQTAMLGLLVVSLVALLPSFLNLKLEGETAPGIEMRSPVPLRLIAKGRTHVARPHHGRHLFHNGAAHRSLAPPEPKPTP